MADREDNDDKYNNDDNSGRSDPGDEKISATASKFHGKGVPDVSAHPRHGGQDDKKAGRLRRRKIQRVDEAQPPIRNATPAAPQHRNVFLPQQPEERIGLLAYIIEVISRTREHPKLLPLLLVKPETGVRHKNRANKPPLPPRRTGKPMSPLKAQQCSTIPLAKRVVEHEDDSMLQNMVAQDQDAIAQQANDRITNEPQNARHVGNAGGLRQQWLGIHNALAAQQCLQHRNAIAPHPAGRGMHPDDGNAVQVMQHQQNANEMQPAHRRLQQSGNDLLQQSASILQAGRKAFLHQYDDDSVQWLRQHQLQQPASRWLQAPDDDGLPQQLMQHQQNANEAQPADGGLQLVRMLVQAKNNREQVVGERTEEYRAERLAQQHLMAEDALKQDLQRFLQQYLAATPVSELKQALQALLLRHSTDMPVNGLRRQMQELLWQTNAHAPDAGFLQEVQSVLSQHLVLKQLRDSAPLLASQQVVAAWLHLAPAHRYLVDKKDPRVNAIHCALRNVGLDSKVFNTASLNPDLRDEDLLALPDMPWDWREISYNKSSLKESTLLALSNKDWDYKFLSRLPWSDGIIAQLLDKDWNYELLGSKTKRGADLLMKTTTKTWDWLGQLGQLVESADDKATVKLLLRKALLKSVEVVWDWHKPFFHSRLANTLLSIALTEIPKCPDEPWDYDKLSAAWWYPIDALLSLGVDKPWNMDAVSARADLTADHVFTLHPNAAWNFTVIDNNPNIMAATARRQQLIKARDIILKVASSVPYGRLYQRQLRMFQQHRCSDTETA